MNTTLYRHFLSIKDSQKNKRDVTFADTGFYLRIMPQNGNMANYSLAQLAAKSPLQATINKLNRLQNLGAITYTRTGDNIKITFNTPENAN